MKNGVESPAFVLGTVIDGRVSKTGFPKLEYINTSKFVVNLLFSLFHYETGQMCFSVHDRELNGYYSGHTMFWFWELL